RSRFVLVLEDLGGMHTGDQLAGATADEARGAIRAIARLHGRNWNAVGQPPLSGFHDVGSPKNRTVLQIIFLAYLVPALEHFGSFFSDEMRALVEAYGPRVAAHLADLRATPQTIVHGDYRLDNMFFDAGDGSETAVVDWQVSGLGSGLYDVAYFMCGSVPTETRREIERDLLAEYADIVRSMGAGDFTFDDCWRLYRQNMLACFLIMIIVSGGLDLDDARMRRLVETGIQRTLAAMEDLDAAEFLPARPVLSSSHMFSSLSRLAYRGYSALR
ncbi:MAG: phosphotransferase, partial [Acidobacteria bacterium]|nr:phosphotransferase [Acidobacteriota bacterium]